MTLDYLERITLSDPAHMMIITNPILINVETLKIDSGC